MSASGSRSENSSNISPTLVSLYDIDEPSAHHCGYCNQNGNISVGMSCKTMQIEDYQLLIDRGWRRSGTYIYKPVMDKTCCPLYTIKCDAVNFQLRKSQKKKLNSFRKYLNINECAKMHRSLSRSEASTSSGDKKSTKSNDDSSLTTQPAGLHKITPFRASKIQHSSITNFEKIKQFFLDNTIKLDVAKCNIKETLNIKHMKAKHQRLFRKLSKLNLHELSSANERLDLIKRCLKRSNRLFGNDLLEDYLKTDSLKTLANKLEISLVRSFPPSENFQETLKEEHELYTKYQTKIHKDSPIECNLSQFQRFLCESPLLQYSHRAGPLNNLKANVNVDHELLGKFIDPLGYGSFHQQYRLNGKLIAVGVIDILNQCVSSVYFFYDPDYQFLNLGTYSSLREISFTRQLNKLDPEIKWFYLGFYAHSCKKMRYKGLYHPSFLLCPEAYTWHPIEYCVDLLDLKKYSKFASSEEVSVEKKESDKMRIDDVKICVTFSKESQSHIFKFNEFCNYLDPAFVTQITSLVTGYCKLFGKKFSSRVVIKF